MSTGVDNGQTPSPPAPPSGQFPTLQPRTPGDADDAGTEPGGKPGTPEAERPGGIPPRPPNPPRSAVPPKPVTPPRAAAVTAPSAAPVVPPRPPGDPVVGSAKPPRPAVPPMPRTPPPAPLPPPTSPPPFPFAGAAPAWDAPGAAGPVSGVARGRRRIGVATAACLVLGLGLIGGATAGAVINHGPRAEQPVADGSPEAFARARDVWRNVPVDQLFPPTVTQQGAGPGGADRSWTRIGVAPPAGCAGAFDPLLGQVLAPAGCVRLLRATYVDSTSSTVTTVGLVVTSGDAAVMSGLNRRWTDQNLGDRTDLLPRTVAFPGTAAAGFGPHQRGSWTVQVSADLPYVVYAVSGFADGRTVSAPQPADKADADGATTATAQAGLGFDATALASAVDDRAHAAAAAALHPTTATPTPRGTS